MPLECVVVDVEVLQPLQPPNGGGQGAADVVVLQVEGDEALQVPDRGGQRAAQAVVLEVDGDDVARRERGPLRLTPDGDDGAAEVCVTRAPCSLMRPSYRQATHREQTSTDKR